MNFSDLFSHVQKGTKRPFFSFRGGPKNKRFKSNNDEAKRKNQNTKFGGKKKNFKQDKTNANKRDFRPIGGTKKKLSRKK